MRFHKFLIAALIVAAEVGPAQGGELGGIGVELGTDGQHVIVTRILPDSPAAAQTNLQVGDRIVAVTQDKGTPVHIQDGDIDQVRTLVRGPQGTAVHITLARSPRVWVERFVRSELKGRWGDGLLLKPGNTAPNIEMVNLVNGTPERLSNYFGKIVILDFWTTWCHPCQVEIAELQTYPERYPNWKGIVALIAVSVDENQDLPVQHLRAKRWDQTHNVWIDAPAVKAFHIDAVPTTYVIDGKGLIVAVNPKDIGSIVNHHLVKDQAIAPR